MFITLISETRQWLTSQLSSFCLGNLETCTNYTSKMFRFWETRPGPLIFLTLPPAGYSYQGFHT